MMTSHIYKQVDGLPVRADIHRPSDSMMRPVVVWVHGGALINGHRESVPGWLLDPLLGAGYVVVSIDYRLAPETKLPGIIEDVEDAFRWLHERGPELFGADTSRVAVTGGSAGGYLTLMTGFRVKPCPACLVSFWGYGDLIGDWYSAPSPHSRHHATTLSGEDVRRQVDGPAISDARDRPGDGGAFYQYCRQQGIWPQEVSGWDPRSEAERFRPYMPVHNVTSGYPPTLLIHGTEDTDVPYEQSVMMGDELREHGVDHELIAIPGGEHGLAGGDPGLVSAAHQSALAFLERHMVLQEGSTE